MKHPILLISLLLIIVSSCKKDCSGEYWASTDYLEISKTEKGIRVKNKYILPIHVTQIWGVANIGNTDTKILSGLAHTFKFEDLIFKQGKSKDDVKSIQVFYYRENCDYKGRGTYINGYSADMQFQQF